MAAMTFKHGDKKPPASGRKAGTPNRQTAALKDAILMATELAGREIDPESPDGLVTYLLNIARSDPRTMAALLGRLLPLQARLDVPELQRIEIVSRRVPYEPPVNPRGSGKLIDARPVEVPVSLPLPKPNGF